LGDYTAALARSQEAEKLFRKLNMESHVASTLHDQGLVLTDLARAAQTDEERTTHLRAAVERFQQSLAISRRIGDKAGAADALGELGKLLMDAGQMHEAIAAFTEVLDIFTRMENPEKVGITLDMLGHMHELQGQYAAALEKYQQALELARQFSSPKDVAIVEGHVARVQAKLRGE
jgi:tetratricopeptide (TPR) repeat protein